MTRTFVRLEDELVERDSELPSIDVLVVAAHNDDEMFPGGYLIEKINEGKKVGIFVATDGAGSNYQDKQGQNLIDERTEESRQAVEELGGSFFIGYDLSSSYVNSDDGVTYLAAQLSSVIDATQPRQVLVTSPFENHYTHIIMANATINALRGSVSKPDKIWGYEVWTPMAGIEMVHPEPMDEETVNKKYMLQSIYKTQNQANPYPQATQSLNQFSSVMVDPYRTSDLGHSELFLDMGPLIHDDRFSGFSAIEYAGGLLILTQIVKSSPLVQVDKINLSREQKLDLLLNIYIPAYQDAANSAMNHMLLE